MKTQSAFWDGLARKYAAQPVKDQETYEAWIARVKAVLRDNDTVLEIGCGTGSTALILAPHVKRYIAADYSAEMIAIAHEKLTENAIASLSFVTASLAEPVIQPAQHGAEDGYDAVMAYSFLHLMDDVPATIKEVHHMLKPEGLFISKTVCLGAKAWLFRPVIAVLKLFGKAPHVQMLTTDMVDHHIEQNGFDIVEATNYGSGVVSRFVLAKKR